jgi:ferredoxin
MMAKEVYVDDAECTGCELCVDTLPEVFEMTSEGVSHVQIQRERRNPRYRGHRQLPCRMHPLEGIGIGISTAVLSDSRDREAQRRLRFIFPLCKGE